MQSSPASMRVAAGAFIFTRLHLHYLSRSLFRHVDFISFLLFCFSALHWAAMNGHAAVCALLVRAGADFNLKNSFGVSPFGEAESAGHMEVTPVLDEFASRLLPCVAGCADDAADCRQALPC